MTRRSVGIVATLVAIFAVALFAPSFGNGLVWDDAIVLERQLGHFGGGLDAFFPSPSIPQWSLHYYRPLVVLSYLADNAIARILGPVAHRDELRPIVFHATPILLHGVASALLVAFAWTLIRRHDKAALAVAGAAGFLFAAHPTHVESVAWLAGRSDVLCAVFYLAAATAWLRYLDSRHPGWLASTGALALGAMLSKETGASLVLLLPLLDLMREQDTRARSARRWLAWGVPFAAAAVYLALRTVALPDSPASAISWSNPGRAVLSALGWYIAKTIWPSSSSPLIAQLPDALHYPLLGGIGATLLVGLVAFAIKRRRLAAEASAAALFLVALTPGLVVSVATFIAAPLADRYLYIPSAGLILLLTLAVAHLAGHRAPAALLALGAALVALAVPATVARQEVWKDDLAFWSRAVRGAPDSALAWNSLGRALAAERRLGEAETHFRRAAELAERAEDRARAHANLGSLHADRQRWDEAIAEFRLAAEIAPREAAFRANLAQALLARYAARPVAEEKPAVMVEAAGHLSAARQLEPRNASFHYAYGMLLIDMGRPSDAIEPLQRALALASGTPEAAAAAGALERLGAR